VNPIAFVALAWVCVASIAFAAGPTNAGKDCGCPAYPALATSKDPAKGRVNLELRLADIEKLFSNRHAMYPGGWDDGMLALAHDIDPSGQLGLWRRAPTVRNPRIKLEEGLFTSKLLAPPDPRGVTGADPVPALLNTLARINKYGEPEQDLRKATLAVLRFLASDLASVPADIAQRDPRALYLSAVGSRARTQVLNALALARPRDVDARLARGGVPALNVAPSDRAELKLDVFDLANAALEVMWASDDPQRMRLIRLQGMDVVRYATGTLATLAAARPQFGGRLTAGAEQDAVACRAYSTLAALADTRVEGSSTARSLLFDLMIDGISAARVGKADQVPMLNATRAAFLWAGVADKQEADHAVDTLVSVAMAGHDDDVPAMNLEIATTLRALVLYAGAPDRDTLRGYMGGIVQARMDELQKRVDAGFNIAGAQDRKIVEAWKAAAGRVTLANPAPGCTPDPGDAKGNIILYAICADGLQVIDELYVGVPTIVEVQFDTESEKKEVPIEVSIGGQSMKLTARVFDRHGRIFRADPILPGTPRVGGPAFDPGVAPKRGGS
jgi:hypothetical protein